MQIVNRVVEREGLPVEVHFRLVGKPLRHVGHVARPLVPLGRLAVIELGDGHRRSPAAEEKQREAGVGNLQRIVGKSLAAKAHAGVDDAP